MSYGFLVRSVEGLGDLLEHDHGITEPSGPRAILSARVLGLERIQALETRFLRPREIRRAELESHFTINFRVQRPDSFKEPIVRQHAPDQAHRLSSFLYYHRGSQVSCRMTDASPLVQEQTE